VQKCCPEGMACNYGENLVVCKDGSCLNKMPGDSQQCPGECDGNWGQVCEDNKLVQACCPVDMVCNFGMTTVMCDDGSCVNMPDTCKEECDGTWEQACENNKVIQKCCPPGVVCNYGQTMKICEDGSCVNGPAMCPVGPK